MPAFAYQALDSGGKTQRGVLQGDTARAVRGVLRDRGLNPLEVTPVTQAQQRGGFFRRGLSGAQLALLTRQLATLLRAGLPVDEALAALAEQNEEQRTRALVVSLRSRVMEGSSLAASLADHPESFPEIFRASIAAGEQSGRLDQVLARLADYSEARDALNQKVWAALAYPILLSLVAVAVVSGLLVYVVPQIVGVFTQMHQALPWATRALLGLSSFVKAWGWLLLILLAVCGSRRQTGAAYATRSLCLASIDLAFAVCRRPGSRRQHGALHAYACIAYRECRAVARRAANWRAGYAEPADARGSQTCCPESARRRQFFARVGR